MTISKLVKPITTLDQWKALAPPKSPGHWVDGRSAKEVARAWTHDGGASLTPGVQSLLSSHQDFGPVLTWQAEPEGKLRFDDFAGEPRNSDIVVHAEDAHGPYLIAVEAKADESFGGILASTSAAAAARLSSNPRSKGLARIESLSLALLGTSIHDEPAVKIIRYQLLTACAGALCEAERRGYSRALVLIEEFVTTKTKDANHARNSEDLNIFVKRLRHSDDALPAAPFIVGPIDVPGAPLLVGSVKLYIGKLTRNLREG